MVGDIDNLKDWRFEIDFEDIAWAVFDKADASVNTLGTRALEELGLIVDTVEGATHTGDVRGLIIMSAKENFIAGADIKEFESFTTETEVRESVGKVTALFDQIEKLKIPVVAAIHGYCLGGGTELAMACHYRIADREEGTRLGLPEVKLGIIPGLHGTVRALRLAGPLSGMEMMLTGRMLRSNAARAIGLVDQLVPTRHALRWAARKAVLRKRRSKGASWWKRLLAYPPIRGLVANQMRKQTSSKVRQDHYPAPFKLIELFENYGNDPERHRAAETRTFAPLMVSDTSRNLRRVFHLSEMLKAQAPKNGFRPLRVHVVGAGTMGADIAAWCVISGMEVSLQDMEMTPIEDALARSKTLFKKRLKKRVAVDAAMARLIPDVAGNHVSRADVIIEAIVENLDIKQKLFSDLEQKAKPDAVLATNTSSLPIEEIAKPLRDPGRLVGIHFFNPVAQLPLVEVVRGAGSRETEVERAVGFVTAINKFPIVVKSAPGFLVNRVLAPYMMTAIGRFQSGTAREKIDEAAKKFGMPMGPLELCDVVGLDVCKHVGEILGLKSGDNSDLERMVKRGKLGKKTGEGFYIWEGGKPQREKLTFSDYELENLGKELVQPMLDESQKCLDDGIVKTADEVDAGIIFGTGFAPFRGGPLHYLTQSGETKVSSAEAA